MKSWMLLVLFSLVMAACSPQPEQENIDAAQSQPEVTAAAVAEAGSSAVERGEQLFKEIYPEVGFACATCHYDYSERRLIGPGLKDFAARAAAYNPNESIEEYLQRSITAPDEFITPGDPPYAPGLMPAIYGQLFTPEELEDLMAYILSL